MAQPPDKSVGTPPASGKVTRDARGNAVWSWVSETGKIAIDSTSRLLKRLDSSDLTLEGSDDDPKPDVRAAPTNSPRAPAGQQGYDPYSAKLARRKPQISPPHHKPIATAQPGTKPVTTHKSFLGRLFGGK
jgi:hypothetical protein